MKKGQQRPLIYICSGVEDEPCTTLVTRKNAHCQRCRARKHYIQNRQKIITKAAEWQRQNPDKNHAARIKSGRKHYQTHRKEMIVQAQQWQREHPDRVRERNHAAYQQNPERVVLNFQRWRKEHPEDYLACKHGVQARRRTRAKVHLDALDRLLTFEYRKAISDDPCFYCGGLGEQDDHYQSLAKGGADYWWNLVRACASCNSQKNTMYGDEFIKLRALKL